MVALCLYVALNERVIQTNTKGQLISECPFDVVNFLKN